MSGILVTDSVTRLGEEARGRVLVAGSHGGVYAAYLAAAAGVRAVVLNDAGVGKDAAGIGGLAWLEGLGIAAATVGHDTARIGDGADMMARGRITHVNAIAAALGCRPGMACRAAAEALRAGPVAGASPPEATEARHAIEGFPAPVAALDSASLVTPDDAMTVLCIGSHGGLLGGRPETALKYDARAAIFNDAGIGIDRAGVSRLPALDRRGIPAAAVAAASARIGDGRSTYEDGILSAVNETAAALGAAPGMSAKDFITRILERRS
ncbi:MAG: hypothetical protein IRZ04_15685 [Rhodospirillales bacterium]|nr:hypothetical protein [Rhodospirillales bacterium]